MSTPSLRCPVLVGRDAELRRLLASVDAVARGTGGLLAVVGDAGTGKTRLVREATAHAEAAGMTVLRGRAVDGATAQPYRPLTEALLGALRGAPRPAGPELEGFERHLGRVLPLWRDHDAGPVGTALDDSPVLAAEAVVRLLRVITGRAGAVLVLEDLHWADAETLAVVDYLLDTVAAEHVCCIVTARPGGNARETLGRVGRHHAGQVVELGPLDGDRTAELVAAALGSANPPPTIVDFVTRHSDGSPLLAEELLAGLAGSGAITFDGGWVVAGDLTPTVPRDLADSVRARLAAWSIEDRRVLGAAAVLGRHFDWNLLTGVAEVDAHDVVSALRTAVAAGLVDVDGHDFRFRHALTREAVLAELLPPERAALSARAWPVVENAHPGLPGHWCDLAAELAEAAGDEPAAVRRLVESAQRALDAGALASAETILRRARRLAGDDAVGIDADECFVEVLSLAGQPREAIDVARALAARMAAEDVDPARQVVVLTTAARAGVAAGDLDLAAQFATEARELADASALVDVGAAIDSVAAHIALDRGDLSSAELLARAAIDSALTRSQPAVACEALEVLGRVARPRSTAESKAAFEQAAGIAERHGLTGWLLRARHELALENAIDGDGTGLRATRELAARHGALISVAVMDLTLADLALTAMDAAAAREHADACVAASRRFGLATLSLAELWLAGAHALEGDDEAMEAAVRRALERDPEDPRILGDLWGRVRATRSLLRDDRDQLREDLEQMMLYADLAPPGTSVFGNRLLWLVLRTIDDDDLGGAAQARIQALDHLSWLPVFWSVLDVARAITLGRRGGAAAAAALLDQALSAIPDVDRASGTTLYLQLLTAEAQIRDGWGDPVSLLRPAEAFFAARGHDLVARRCRVALRDAGAPMPRRGRGESAVPEQLRAWGITSREHDVLLLLVEGRSNREIAERLYLSPKTVERHVASLFDRTGIRSRTDLAAWVVDAAK